MSNPDTTATQPEPTAPVEKQEEPTWEEKLKIAEQRRRDTQAAYTKGQQELKALKAEKQALLDIVSKSTKVELPAEEQERLDSLKYSDPEAWRNEVNRLEEQQISEARTKVAELTGEASEVAKREFELNRRQQVLEEFNASAEVPITAELIATDVPPRFTKKLEEGQPFEEFLEDVSKYLNTGKVVENPGSLDQPNLGDMAGGIDSKDIKPAKSLTDSYKNDLY